MKIMKCIQLGNMSLRLQILKKDSRINKRINKIKMQAVNVDR